MILFTRDAEIETEAEAVGCSSEFVGTSAVVGSLAVVGLLIVVGTSAVVG